MTSYEHQMESRDKWLLTAEEAIVCLEKITHQKITREFGEQHGLSSDALLSCRKQLLSGNAKWATRFEENQQVSSSYGISDRGQKNSPDDFIPWSFFLDGLEFKEEPFHVQQAFDGGQNESSAELTPKESYGEEFEIKEECLHEQQTLCEEQSLDIFKSLKSDGEKAVIPEKKGKTLDAEKQIFRTGVLTAYKIKMERQGIGLTNDTTAIIILEKTTPKKITCEFGVQHGLSHDALLSCRQQLLSVARSFEENRRLVSTAGVIADGQKNAAGDFISTRISAEDLEFQEEPLHVPQTSCGKQTHKIPTVHGKPIADVPSIRKPFVRKLGNPLHQKTLASATDQQIDIDDTEEASLPSLSSKRFSCSECLYSTNFRYTLAQHVTTHDPKRPKPFACPHCLYRTSHKGSLKCHMYTHKLEVKRFPCPQCPYVGTRVACLRVHRKTHDQQRPKRHRCEHCPYKTDFKTRMETHALTHDLYRERPFECSKCHYRATIESDLKKHLRIHDPNRARPFACHICTYRAYDKNKLRLHLKIHDHERVKPFGCPQCSFRSDGKGRLELHLQLHSEVKRFSCSHCSYRSHTKANLAMHVRVHENIREKPFSCAYCYFATDNKNTLAKHSRTHDMNREKPFKCSICSFCTVRKGSLESHQLTHQEHREKIFSCSKCSFRTDILGAFKTHAGVHASNRETLYCSLCSYKTINNENLRRHLYAHKTKQPLTFTCEICSYTTGHKCALKLHKKKVHDVDRERKLPAFSVRTKHIPSF